MGSGFLATGECVVVVDDVVDGVGSVSVVM